MRDYGYDEWRSQKTVRRLNSHDLAQAVRPPGAEVVARLGRLAGRLRYPRWQFSSRDERGTFSLIAFRPHPETGALQRLGPWPLPEEAGEEEVLAIAMLAVAETDGPDAVARLEWLSPPEVC